jgi:hypothetical protein
MKRHKKDSAANNNKRWPGWLNRQTLILLLLAAIFLGALTLSEPLPRPNRLILNETAAVDKTQVKIDEDTPEALPEEWLENVDQTDGIILGGIILVLIIVIGTFSVIRRKY